MLWMTRASMLDSVEDLAEFPALLIQTGHHGASLMRSLLGLTEDEPHKVSAMSWSGYEPALGVYVSAVSAKLQQIGVSNHLGIDAKGVLQQLRRAESADYEPLPWIEDTDILQSHRSNMIRRWSDKFAPVWPRTPRLWPYLVPVVDGEGQYDIVVSKAERAMLKSGERELPASVKKRVSNL